MLKFVFAQQDGHCCTASDPNSASAQVSRTSICASNRCRPVTTAQSVLILHDEASWVAQSPYRAFAVVTIDVLQFLLNCS